MKKFLVTLLVAMLALSCVALADTMDSAYNHGYDDTTGKMICPSAAASKTPTCTEEGWCIHEVSGIKSYYVLEKLPHTPKAGASELTKEPTCSEYGEYTHICSVCGETFTTKVAPTSHPDVFFFLQAPTCTTVGIGATGCPYCETYDPATLVTWWAKGAAGTETQTTIDGVKYGFNKDCAKTNTSNDPKKHVSPSSWLIISEKDCYNPLVKQSYCSACQTTMTVVEAKKPHELGAEKLVMLNDPNCETIAIYAVVQECKNCDYFEALEDSVQTKVTVAGGVGTYYNIKNMSNADAIDALNKYWNKLNTSANEKTTGAYYFKTRHFLFAKYVDDTVGGIDAYAKGHHVANPATRKLIADMEEQLNCSYEGNEKHKWNETWTNVLGQTVTTLYNTYGYKCAVCEKSLTELDEHVVLTAPAHDYTAWKQIVEPTEDTNFIGKWSRYCMDCGKLEEYIGGVCGKENHLADEAVLENVVEATYTADGSADEVVYCAVCGEEMSRTEIVLPMLEGINEDGILYEDGKASTATGIVSFGGKDYYLINGKKTESMGATLVDGTWYFMAHGIVQKVTQLAEYQGEWFVVENGKIDISYNGLVEYDGAKFLVGAGRIQTEQTTLYNDGTNWYLISAGKVATEYTGAFTYDGQVFDVVAGIVK